MNGVPLAPTATAYVAYLYRIGLAENIYSFTNVLVHGTSPLFVKFEEDTVMDDMEEKTPAEPIFRRGLAKEDGNKWCAPEGQYALECIQAAPNEGWPPECCKGLTCHPNTAKCEPPCAANGAASKACGAKGNVPQGCCDIQLSTYGCDGENCAEPFPDYSGGRVRKLSISAPGLLVEG